MMNHEIDTQGSPPTPARHQGQIAGRRERRTGRPSGWRTPRRGRTQGGEIGAHVDPLRSLRASARRG